MEFLNRSFTKRKKKNHTFMTNTNLNCVYFCRQLKGLTAEVEFLTFAEKNKRQNSPYLLDGRKSLFNIQKKGEGKIYCFSVLKATKRKSFCQFDKASVHLIWFNIRLVSVGNPRRFLTNTSPWRSKLSPWSDLPIINQCRCFPYPLSDDKTN